jgi:uracil-DNA glycosylase
LANCRAYLGQELQMLNNVRVVVALGRVAWHAYLLARRELERPVPVPRPKFAHSVSHRLDDQTTVITSYHPSQQNTQTGRLTPEMFDEVFAKARKLLG